MKIIRTKRIAAWLLAGALALSLVSGLSLPALAAEESALAALYRQMAGQRPECRSLARDCGRFAAILRGICLFQERQPGKAAPPEGNIRNGLRLCCARTLRCIAADLGLPAA